MRRVRNHRLAQRRTDGSAVLLARPCPTCPPPDDKRSGAGACARHMAQHAEHWALSVEQDLLAHPRAEALLCGFGFCHAGGGVQPF